MAGALLAVAAILPALADTNPADPASSGAAPAADSLAASTPAPAIRWQAPANVRVSDEPDDNGHGVVVHFDLSPDDASLMSYQLFRVPDGAGSEADWLEIGAVPRGTKSYTYRSEDASLDGAPNPRFVQPKHPVTVAVRGVSADGALSPFSAPATGTPAGNLFNTGMLSLLLGTLLFGALVVYFIQRSKRGEQLYIRPIGGINAVDEAIGRATEMGRPILYCLGTGTAGDIATIAGYTILARVAKRTAEYQTPILVPVQDPVVLAMAQETVKEAYLQAGRPDVYNPDTVYYISAMQFPYVAAVNGVMLREKCATTFYMGVFHAESLLLAEAGSSIGAIQISGTDQPSQIPFFVAATDYTLIGEELYAASAYLSQDPVLMGPLKAQDWYKLIILAVIVLGVLEVTLLKTQFIEKIVHTV